MKKILFINGSPYRNGATDKIFSLLLENIDKEKFICKVTNLSDFDIKYCTGCTTCYQTLVCYLKDDLAGIMSDMENADGIVIISPSYWADITGQLKVFFDRLTPYCNTHSPHARLPKGKKGFAVALRTGSNPCECLHIVESINHFYGHLEIDFEDDYSMYFCSIDRDSYDISKHENEIKQFADLINRTV